MFSSTFFGRAAAIRVLEIDGLSIVAVTELWTANILPYHDILSTSGIVSFIAGAIPHDCERFQRQVFLVVSKGVHTEQSFLIVKNSSHANSGKMYFQKPCVEV